MLTASDQAGHEITPRKGSMHHAVTGEPVTGLHPALDYPIVAVCLVCGRVIRLERFFLCSWVHVSDLEQRCVPVPARQ